MYLCNSRKLSSAAHYHGECIDYVVCRIVVTWWVAGMYGWMSMQEEEFDELWVGLTNKDFSLTLLRLLRQICIGAVYSWHVVAEKSSELIVVEV